MNKITISTGHPDAGRVYAEAYDAASAREEALREELARYKSLFGQAQKAIDRLNELHPKRMGELAKRLSVAEQLLQRVHQADALSHCCPLWKAIDAALKPAEVGNNG